MARFPRLLLIAVLATALLLPAAADARGVRSHGPRLSSVSRSRASAHKLALARLAAANPVTIAAAVAERYWGAAPCGGQVTVLANLPIPAGLEPSTDGWVTFNSSLGQNNLQAPARTYTQCVISLAHWQWPTRSSIEGDWNMFCLTIVHEMGHLLGHPHSLIGGSVMAPVFVNEANVPAICRSTRPPDPVALRSRHRSR